MTHFNELSEKLWQDYILLNPEAEKILKLFKENNTTIENDHIALRTFNQGTLTKEHFAEFFKGLGYFANGDYHFKQKQLNAIHLENKDPQLPKIFISELISENFSPQIQAMVQNVVKATQGKSIADLFNERRNWDIQYKDYVQFNKESEYASWVYAFGFCANHFTVSVNSLSQFTELADLNAWLKSKGFVLNSSGGEIKGTPEQMLVQSSTMAPAVEVEFTEGKYSIPGCYYEFAKRFEETSGKLFQGFIAQSADKIFESTNER